MQTFFMICENMIVILLFTNRSPFNIINLCYINITLGTFILLERRVRNTYLLKKKLLLTFLFYNCSVQLKQVINSCVLLQLFCSVLFCYN